MASLSDNTPSFLKNAKRVSEKPEEKKEPSFLKKAKRISPSQEVFSTPEEDEREYERASAQLTSRGLESVLGAPGDIGNFIGSLFGAEFNLPGSQKLREFSEKSTGGYTTPKTEFEEKTGEVISDIASMALPGTNKYSLVRNIGIPIVGNLVKEGLKYTNSSDKAQGYGKVGTMVVLDLLNRRAGGSKKYVSDLYQKAEAAIPEGSIVEAKGLENALAKVEKELSKGGTRATTKKALEKVAEIKNEIQNGQIDAKNLAAYRPSINEAIDELGGFQLEVPKKLTKKAVHNLNLVKKEVINTLSEYGEKANPEFLKYHQASNEAYAAMQKSNVIANFLKDKVPFSPKSKAVQALFSYAPGAAALSLAKLSPLGAAGALGAVGGYQGFKVLHQVVNSPTLRKYYGNVLKEAAAGNSAATTRNLKALDKLSLDQERKEKKSFE